MSDTVWQMCPYNCGTKIEAKTNGGLGKKLSRHMDNCKNNPNRKK